MRLSRICVLGGVGMLSACAAGPVPVAGVPGPNKDPATFQKDEQACRTEAGQAVYPAASSDNKTPPPASPNSNAQWQAFFARYAQCQTSKGNTVVAIPWAAAYADYLGYVSPYGFAGPAYAYGYPAYYYGDAFFWGDPFFYGFYGPYLYGFGYYGRYGFYRGGHFGHFGGGFHGGGHH